MLLSWPLLQAASPPEPVNIPTKSPQPEEPATDTSVNLDNLKNNRQIRVGSLLAMEEEAINPPAPDLRSEAELFRDQELFWHYGFMAELAVIALVAKQNNELAVIETVNNLRRLENQRFFKMMQKWKKIMRDLEQRGATADPIPMSLEAVRDGAGELREAYAGHTNGSGEATGTSTPPLAAATPPVFGGDVYKREYQRLLKKIGVDNLDERLDLLRKRLGAKTQ